MERLAALALQLDPCDVHLQVPADAVEGVKRLLQRVPDIDQPLRLGVRHHRIELIVAVVVELALALVVAHLLIP
ncbi:hypothetical protein SMD11_1883 [Streptomyces albireticuli]|uniref:Uncharacterized protein n=1 Tax=Streptomyces albireticuli TaxID=1940 RepID=A0A1Z2KZT7_9ACTN|nr:hypothetical protein SMD11_1883 [Streptomyces albireticuli]